ncbi:hypothetical protein FNH22_19005 [Fulvivirga sp. M361]|uniref:hypothetical protein n=1 Tax=Fulvivirga sp. M361 TaxID=2594266 RepID=UPI001179E16F|nr:hypothetical protein [Fulvivirga sp. M361]TRX54845.1 hypothetical protein FNH22_19005 [Fulvivirga sp. M361]
MKFSLEQITDVLKQKGYKFFDAHKPYNLNIIGIRSNEQVANSFDDWLYLIFRNDALETQLHEFPVTTDPGNYWLQNPTNVNGTAILVPGQYRGSHEIRKHQGRYDALCQKADMKVWRDKNNDDVLDMNGTIYTGIFGINIHRSNASSESERVEKWSAGCQVFKRVHDFNFFMNLCRKAVQLYGNSFTYTLLEEKDF